MSLEGHFRQIDPLPTPSACPLRSDRFRTFAPQRIDAVCQDRTLALQQKELHARSRRIVRYKDLRTAESGSSWRCERLAFLHDVGNRDLRFLVAVLVAS